jgi:diadenosine tetraphosphate (Ap4A) HIT family hydrolase
MSVSAPCQYCDYLRDGLPGGWVYEDEHWAAGGYPLNDVPGWIVVMLRRHFEQLPDLTDAELATFGPVAARLSSAIATVTSAIKVYLVVFGEMNTHFHGLLAARTTAMQEDHRGAAMLMNRRVYADPDAAAAVATNLRSYLAHD